MAWAQLPSTDTDDDSPVSQELLDQIRENFDANRLYLTRAALKSADPPTEDRDSAFVLGDESAGDGGHGRYYWDATSTTADDGLTVLQPDSAPASGRWLLLPSVGAIHSERIYTDDDTTPSVLAQDRITINYSALSQIDITNFDDGVDGQVIRVWFRTTWARVVPSATIVTPNPFPIQFGATGGFAVFENIDGVWHTHYAVQFPNFDLSAVVNTSAFTPTTTEFEVQEAFEGGALNGPPSFYIGLHMYVVTPNGVEETFCTDFSTAGSLSHVTVSPALSAPPTSTVTFI